MVDEYEGVDDGPTGDAEKQSRANQARNSVADLPAKQESAQDQGQDAEKRSYESGPKDHQNTKWKRFLTWVWPMEFSNAVMIVLTFFIAVGTIVSAIAIGFQWHEMHSGGADTHDLAVAAKAQSETAQRTLTAMQATASETKAQVDRLIAEEKRTADSMRDTVAQAQKSMDASERQGSMALAASMDASRLDQRAWVGVISTETIGGAEDHDTFGFRSGAYVVRNSGKTPALNVSVECCAYTSRTWEEETPTWEQVLNEMETTERADREATIRKLDTLIRDPKQDPAVVASFQKQIQTIKDSPLNFETLFSNSRRSGVLAPGDPQLNNFGGYRVAIDRTKPRAVYVIGRIAYRDIFAGTPLHTTSICFVRRTGNALALCEDGQTMN